MPDAAPQSAPPGYKHLAWEGVGLFVPQRWELGRRNGNDRQGWFRIDDEQRMAAQVKWWTSGRLVSLDVIAGRHIQEVFGKTAAKKITPKKRDDLELPENGEDRAAAFLIDPTGEKPAETLIVWQRPALKRIAVFRILRTPGDISQAMLKSMVAGLILQVTSGWRLWSVHDFAVQSPPGFSLATAGLNAGVCYLRFERRRASIALRRFSAADAVLNSQSPDMTDLRKWCRVIYASEFHDMRYEITEETDLHGRPKLRLTARPRLLAPIELSWLVPKHRRLPQRIDIIWNRDANKIYCIEIRKETHFQDGQIEAFERSLHMTLDHDALSKLPSRAARKRALETAADDETAPSWEARKRSLEARVSVSDMAKPRVDDAGHVHVTYPYRRSQPLRILRFFGGATTGPEIQERELELDMIGSALWRECDGQKRVCDLVSIVERRFKISYREAEQSVVEYVRNLGNRGLLNLQMDD